MRSRKETGILKSTKANYKSITATDATVSDLAKEAECYESRLQSVKSRNNSCIGVTQENSIEFLIQSSLPYILFPMVCASYCALYPKRP